MTSAALLLAAWAALAVVFAALFAVARRMDNYASCSRSASATSPPATTAPPTSPISERAR